MNGLIHSNLITSSFSFNDSWICHVHELYFCWPNREYAFRWFIPGSVMVQCLHFHQKRQFLALSSGNKWHNIPIPRVGIFCYPHHGGIQRIDPLTWNTQKNGNCRIIVFDHRIGENITELAEIA